MRDPRTVALLFTALLLASVVPVLAAPATAPPQLWDFQITGIRAATVDAEGYATNGWFPRVGEKISILVKVQAFETTGAGTGSGTIPGGNAPQGTPFDFPKWSGQADQQPVYLVLRSGTITGASTPPGAGNFLTQTDPPNANGCVRIDSIPAAGREVRVDWTVQQTVTDIVAVINARCHESHAYTPYAENGEADPARDLAPLRIDHTNTFDPAIHQTRCYDSACTDIDYGPGKIGAVRGGNFVREENATRYCLGRPSTLNTSSAECDDGTGNSLHIGASPRTHFVYFRVNVSDLGSYSRDVSTAMSAAEPATTSTGFPNEHVGERSFLYPDNPSDGVPAKPILIPLRFEVHQITGPEGAQTSRIVANLTPAHYSGSGITANCDRATPTNCVRWVEKDGQPTFTPVWSTPLDLYRLGGTIEVRAILNGGDNCQSRSDINNLYAPDADCRNNVGILRLPVKAADLVTFINHTAQLDQRFQPTGTLSFEGYVENVGDFPTHMPIGTFPSGTQPLARVNTTIQIDDAPPIGFVWKNFPRCPAPVSSCAFDGPGVPGDALWLYPGEKRYFGVTYPLNSLQPGSRVVKVVTDPRIAPKPLTGSLTELDETNNDATFRFLIEDRVAPVLSNLRVRNVHGELVTGTPAEVARGGAVTFLTDITDTDHSITDVQLELTRPNGQAYACTGDECTFTQESRAGNVMTYTLELEDGLLEVGDWKWRIAVTDPAGNEANSSDKTLRVSAFRKRAEFNYLPWPANGTYRMDGEPPTGVPANGSAIRWSPNQYRHAIVNLFWNVTGDPRTETGFGPAWSSEPYTLRFTRPNSTWMKIENPSLGVFYINNSWGSSSRIDAATGKRNFSDADFADCVNPETPGAGELCVRYRDDNKFSGLVVDVNEQIGLWNASLTITDVGGAEKTYWTFFRVRDGSPQPNITLVHPEPGRWLKTNESVKYRVTAKDDLGFGDTGGAFLNFTHVATNVTVNVSTTRVGECTADGGFTRCLHEAVVKTGRSVDGAKLNRSGRWNLTTLAVDKNGNWNRTWNQTNADGTLRGPAYVLVNDTQPPRLSNFGTSQPEEEVGANVTFWARASDDTDFDVFLTVKEGSQLFADRVRMKDPDNDGNYTYDLSFDAPHTLVYQVTLVDTNASRSHIVSSEKSIAIRDNLPPRFDVRSPFHVPDVGYYGKASPTVEVRVYDTAQGVAPGSVKLTVDGTEVTTIERTPTDAGRGFLVRYVHDPSRPFLHGQKVNLTLTGEDLSDPPRPATLRLNFTVDAIAPKSRIVSFDPKFVGREGDLYNVSLSTKFTPASDDAEDQLPTGVKEIRYQFLRNGPGRTFTYNNTPFPMSDLPAAQNVGNGEYFVRVLGVDDVGNVEVGSASNTLQVYLDQVPPELVGSRLKTTGRTVNASFDDQGSGTRSARLHYRYDGGAYAILDMVRQPGGTWTATIPVKADAKNVAYFLEATDNVGNRKQFGDESGPRGSFPVGNRAPTISILAPEDGAKVSGQVTLSWEASDPDGDPLTFKVYYRAASQGDELELITLNAPTSSYVIDTVRLGSGRDGLYDFRVTASDGHFFEEADVRLDVQNSATPIPRIGAEKSAYSPGDIVCYSARVTKQDASVVEARFLLNGEQVAVTPLNDAGQSCDARAGDGVWSGATVLTSTGRYDVEVYARYVEAGEAKEASARETGSFEIKTTAADVLGGNVGLVGAVAALAVAVLALGGYAAFSRWKK